MSKLTVILPAAGKGTRLNLPYPKEILRINNDEALIDNSFNFFREALRNCIPGSCVPQLVRRGVLDFVYVMRSVTCVLPCAVIDSRAALPPPPTQP